MIRLKEIIYWLLALQITWMVSGQEFGTIVGKWKIKYGIQDEMPALHVTTNNVENLPLKIYDIEPNTQQSNNIYYEFIIENTKLATVEEKRLNLSDIEGSFWEGVLHVKGLHIGYTQLYITLNDPQTDRIEKGGEILEIKVLRNKRIDDKIFTYTAAAIMLLMFINLGTVLDLKRVSPIFLRPVGPLLGFCSRYIVMPALAIGLGVLMFKTNKNLQLALLFTAIAPSGGIANICNVFLKGNINLSLAITTLNSVLALGMLPLWIFLMGPVLYQDSKLNLPFVDLAVGCVGLLLALIVGVILRTFIPKTTQFIFRFLKPVSVLLSLCLVAVTVGINAFAFKEITLMIFLAALFLPIIGYILSFVLSKILCRSITDAMTIAVETSVLNMSLPIVLLEYTVTQPMADMLIVVPILSALLSLCLIVIFYIVRRIFGWNTKRDLDAFDEETFLVE
ncbi:sodium/bile acid cotransporter [Lucilia cuprina]|uniref:sodium/bile acid cotransporter n=1 Tax=Lucilia cuprina TaxID=7375 RepID=UPI001F067B37|nr:sodium/bile acid cotransporter [Lucilia cuprina]